MNVCLDAGFLIGLYDKRDQHHQRSKGIFAQLFEEQRYNNAVIAWPALYEARLHANGAISLSP
jgi:predicted nucleic acid-binding protein